MKKFLASLLIAPLFFLSGCSLLGPDPLEYHNDLVAIENDLSEIATSLETTLTPIMTETMTDGFDQAKYDEAIAPTLTKLDANIASVKELGGFEGDESVSNALIESANAIKEVFEGDVPALLTALTETPEEAEALMTGFIEKMTAMQKYDDDLAAALKTFDEAHGIQ